MKITLAGLLIFGTMMAHAQTDAIEVAAAGGSMETAALMTPADDSAPKAEYELTCRAQAKEVAANAYRSCIRDGRNAQIEQLKKDYQDQIAALKAKYESEIKALASANAAAAAEKAAPAMKVEAAAPAPVVAVTPIAATKAVKNKKKAAAPSSGVAGTKKALNPGKAKATAPKATKAAAVSAAPAVDAKPIKAEEIKEMTIELKPSVNTAGATDDSTMDLPEPIAVETN